MSPRDHEPDGGVDVGFDEQALYRVVRHAVEDAILGVLGTLMLVGIAFVVLVVGARLIVEAQSPVFVAVGVGAIAYAVYLAAATLGVIPSVREFL